MPRRDPGRKRCAIYTRKSSEEGLEQEFNSLQAQSEACEAYIRSQRHEGWVSARSRYDDGGFSGGNLDRPALQRLIADIRAGRIDIVVVYKVDRLTRSLADFARLVEIFDKEGVSFVSVRIGNRLGRKAQALQARRDLAVEVARQHRCPLRHLALARDRDPARQVLGKAALVEIRFSSGDRALTGHR
jgi:DNA invertase Pin-like site-specific DNA recombinase